MCLNNIFNIITSERFGVNPLKTAISVQYVGGEILTIPQKKLLEIVNVSREFLGARFAEYRDGAQSNLIANEDKAKFLHTLFGKNISTSVDHFTGQRSVGGSNEKYQSMLQKSVTALKQRRNFSIPRIFVVDRSGLDYVGLEIAIAEKDMAPIRLRPVFRGKNNIDPADIDAMASVFTAEAKKWLLSGKIIVDPFYEMLIGRLNQIGLWNSDYLSGCPFSYSCATHSLDIEPDGSLFVCLDMADSGQLRLGNAVTGEFDWSAFETIKSRKTVLDEECKQCKWLQACRGGCPSEGISVSGGIAGKTDLCKVWKSVFSVIDEAIETAGPERITNWVASLGCEHG